MKSLFSYLIFLFLASFGGIAQTVISMKIDGSINPVTADFIHSGIEKAKKEKAECLVIHLNTPGGLLKSTRVTVSDILQSPVPIVVYVSPEGAHAGSAGVFITMAANIAAMAPGTLKEIAAENNSTTIFPVLIDLLKPFLNAGNKKET